MTHIQTINWSAALNARDALNILHTRNTQSVCAGTPFLTPEERQQIVDAADLCHRILGQLERNERSAPDHQILLVTGEGEPVPHVRISANQS